MNKKNLRREYLAKRISITDSLLQGFDDKILNQFRQIRLPEIVFAMSYISIALKREIIPLVIEQELKKQFQYCNLCYPKTSLDGFNMEASMYVEIWETAISKLGTIEPISNNIVDPKQIDLIIVPLLCFDKIGYRVGYGKGFYDRYLTRCRPDVMTIGLSYFEPVESIDDVDEYDIPLKYCITPDKLYTFL